MHSISTRKPVAESERCGVITAEKIVGSADAALSRLLLSLFMALIIRETWREKPLGKAATPPARARAKRPARKSRKAQGKADAKAAPGELPQWTTAEIDEAFRRFAAANPTPRGELQSINPFTLLVAVVLSAQATDAGVNKATPALFKLADTPEKMVKLGEARVRALIKTIGLYRTKAKNVIALSRMLIAEHGGKVPHDRDALEALPGVGRKTANVVLNIAFGEPTIAVDTHIFRVGNRTGLAPGKTPLEVETKLMRGRARALPPARAPLAHPARPLCLRRAAAAVREMFDRRFVQMAGEDNERAIILIRMALAAREIAEHMLAAKGVSGVMPKAMRSLVGSMQASLQTMPARL